MSSISQALQSIHIGFSCQLLNLQIQLYDNRFLKQPKMQVINKLVKLYRQAIQILEINSDGRYEYFNFKIQELMKRKDVIEQLNRNQKNMDSNRTNTKKTHQSRKRNLQLQIMMTQQQLDSTLIRQIIKNSQTQFRKINKNINTHLKKQQQLIEQRRRNRKIKTQIGSLHSSNLQNISTIDLNLSTIDLNLSTIDLNNNQSLLQSPQYNKNTYDKEGCFKNFRSIKSLKPLHKRNISQFYENNYQNIERKQLQPFKKTKITQFHVLTSQNKQNYENFIR